MKFSKNHKPYFTKDGIEVPSVTTILSILNKPSLLHWSNWLGFKKIGYSNELNRYAMYGTIVHKAIEDLITKGYYDTPDNIDEEDFDYSMRNYEKWRNTVSDFSPIFNEKALVSEKYGYGGTVDFFCSIDGKNTIVDFKTSKTFRYSMFIQLAFYLIMLEELGYTVDQVGIVLVNPLDGGNKFLSRKEMDKYIPLALSLLKTFMLYYTINEEDWKENIL